MCLSPIAASCRQLARGLAARGWSVEQNGYVLRMSSASGRPPPLRRRRRRRSRQPQPQPASASRSAADQQPPEARNEAGPRTRSRFRSTGRRPKATPGSSCPTPTARRSTISATGAMWPVKATILTGPRRSGRTLLARSFVERVGGRCSTRPSSGDEEELFHAWNQAQDSGRPLVMVADEVPPAWAPQLPDLRTRLAVTPVATIGLPDDALVRSADPVAVRRPRAAHPGRGAALHGRAAGPRLLDGRARGRGGRPLRHRRAGAADPADDPAGAVEARDDRRRGLSRS